jgi:HEAT repeat protein
VLVVAGWRDFPEIAVAGLLRSQVPVAYGFGLAVHSRAAHPAAVASQVALAERADHVAEHRPWWLVACGLARDPAAGPRARIVLGDPHSDERLRAAAVDVLAMLGETAPLREAIVLDASVRVRRRAADACARHGTDADVVSLRQAAAMTVAAEERAALLVALGRTRVAAAVATLRAATQEAPAVVRRGAWLGLAHWLRWRGETPLANLPRCAAHTWQPRWLLDVVDAVR